MIWEEIETPMVLLIDKDSLSRNYYKLVKAQRNEDNSTLEIVCGRHCVKINKYDGTGGLGGWLCHLVQTKDRLVKEFGIEKYNETIKETQETLKREEYVSSTLLGEKHILFKYNEVELIVEINSVRTTWVVYKAKLKNKQITIKDIGNPLGCSK